jgi:hypothetical protein
VGYREETLVTAYGDLDITIYQCENCGAERTGDETANNEWLTVERDYNYEKHKPAGTSYFCSDDCLRDFLKRKDFPKATPKQA